MVPVKIIFLAVGNELLSGRTQDLNTIYLAKTLNESGLEFLEVQILKDDEKIMAEAIKNALLRADVVIMSGGIGPTKDDKTKKVLADTFFKKILPREDAKLCTKVNYARLQRHWDPNLNFYHHFPEDFFPVNNPRGLAPGLAYFISHANQQIEQKKVVLAAPGVPNEFQAMLRDEFIPLMATHFGHRIAKRFQTIIRTKGIAEENIFGELIPTLWEDLSRMGEVSSLPHTLGIDIVVTSYEENQSKKIYDFITHSKLAPYIWQLGPLSIAELVLKNALAKKITFGLAESCTGGLVSSKITDIPGSSCAFYGSIICYDNSIKEKILGVSPDTLSQFGAVSVEVAKEMAQGALKKLQTDIIISLSGIAGPDGGTDIKPVGTLALGYATKNQCSAKLITFPFRDRIRLKERFAEESLVLLKELIDSI